MGTFRFRQFTICQDHAAMKVGTDSDLIGALAHGGRRILDIGTGTGVLALMMAQRFAGSVITAVEIDAGAVTDARTNFAASPWSDRIELVHSSFQDFLEVTPAGSFDAIVCNPPYFVKSLECDDPGRNRARHASSLPFDVLARGAYGLLSEEGTFSVCIPSEAYGRLDSECILAGFWPKVRYEIHTVPGKPVRRYILVYSKARVENPLVESRCMSNADRTPSEWLRHLLKDFLLGR